MRIFLLFEDKSLSHLSTTFSYIGEEIIIPKKKHVTSTEEKEVMDVAFGSCEGVSCVGVSIIAIVILLLVALGIIF